MGPTWVLSAPDEPHVDPMDPAITECQQECISVGLCQFSYVVNLWDSSLWWIVSCKWKINLVPVRFLAITSLQTMHMPQQHSCYAMYKHLSDLCVKLLMTASYCITHWGWVKHIFVSKLTIVGSNNGLSPGRRQAIIWTNVGMLSIGPLGINFSEILIGIFIEENAFEIVVWKMAAILSRPQCVNNWYSWWLTLHCIHYVHRRYCYVVLGDDIAKINCTR